MVIGALGALGAFGGIACEKEAPPPAAPSEPAKTAEPQKTATVAASATPASVGDGQCTSDGECRSLLAICPHPSAPNRAECVRPWVNGEHRPGSCNGVTCETDSKAECEALVRKCVAAPDTASGRATWRDISPRETGHLAGICQVWCPRWPSDGSPGR
jgi:hypothetical protein